MKRQTWFLILAIAVVGVVIWRYDDVRSLVGGTNSAGPGTNQASTGQGSGGGAGASRAISVTTAEVALTAPRDRIQSIGTGKAIRSVKVIADVAGTIEDLHVRPNTEVAAGDPVVTLERKTQEIILESAKAELEKQNAAFARYETLINQNSNAVSQAQVDEARASLAAAEASVAAAQYEFDRRIIRAPFSGLINLNDLTIGTYLPQGAEVVSLIDASKLLVEFAVPETAVGRIQVGVPVRLSTPAFRGRVFRGSITAFDSSIDAEYRTVRVRAEVRNPDNVLLPGMTFNVIIQSPDEPMPVVPAVSILWNQNGAYVWRLDPENGPQEVSVVLRHRDSDDVWVEGELASGDLVITDGAFKISPGSEVTTSDAGAAEEQPRG